MLPVKIHIIILAPLKEELHYFLDYFGSANLRTVKLNEFEFQTCQYQNINILFAATGIGTTFIASALTLLNLYFKPEYVFLSGSAGGINPHFSINDVVIVKEAYLAEFIHLFAAVENTPFANCLHHPIKGSHFPQRYQASSTLMNLITALKSHAKIGTAVTSDAFPTPLQFFSQIKNAADCIDMETSAFYQVAWLFNLNALAIRGISNLIDFEGKDENIGTADLAGAAYASAQMTIQVIEKVIQEKYND